MAEARSMDHVWFADGGDVDQRPDRLRILASRPDPLSMAFPKNQRRQRMVRLVAVGRVVRDILNLGDGRMDLGPALS